MHIETTERRYIVTPETQDEYMIIDFLLHACAVFSNTQRLEKKAAEDAQFAKIVDAVYQQLPQAGK
jgi:hypothetical protein